MLATRSLNLSVVRFTDFISGLAASPAMNRWAINAESVGQCQPRVCFETLGQKCPGRLFATLKGLRLQAFSQGCQSATLGWNWRTLSALFVMRRFGVLIPVSSLQTLYCPKRDEVSVTSALAHAFLKRASIIAASSFLPCALSACIRPNSDQPLSRLRFRSSQ